MSTEKFDDECEGCRPVAFDPATGRVLPDDHPVMVAVMGVWETMPLDQRRAFHRVTCLNSRDPNDLLLVERMAASTQAALEAAGADMGIDVRTEDKRILH